MIRLFVKDDSYIIAQELLRRKGRADNARLHVVRYIIPNGVQRAARLVMGIELPALSVAFCD